MYLKQILDHKICHLSQYVHTYQSLCLLSDRFLQQSLRNKTLGMSDYKIALLCNAYSTNSECFTLPMGVLVETIYGNGSMRINLPGTNCMASGSVTPLPMNLLDSLTVHAKMRCGKWRSKC